MFRAAVRGFLESVVLFGALYVLALQATSTHPTPVLFWAAFALVALVVVNHVSRVKPRRSCPPQRPEQDWDWPKWEPTP